MAFDMNNFSKLIQNEYYNSWFIWIGFLVFGFLILKYSNDISSSRRETNRTENLGVTLIVLSVLVHAALIWSFF